MPPTAGEVTVRGRDVFRNALEVRRQIGYLPEKAPLYTDMTARDYLGFVGEMRGLDPRDVAARVKRVSDTCGLDGMLDRVIGTLSKGYRQRVGLAQAMIHDPEILILDEPTSGLDPNQIVEIRNLIREIGRKKTVILSTHNLAEVQAASTRVIIIHRGRIVADAPTGEIQKKMTRNRYEVVIEADGKGREEARRGIRDVPGVEQVEPAGSDEASWTFDVVGSEGGGLRAGLFRFAVKTERTLLELRPEKQSLESVFMELTQE
jgi:ABC-2 type transport system ATP-binding protein